MVQNGKLATIMLAIHSFITFQERRSRGEMYTGDGRLGVSPSPHFHTTAWTRM